MERGLVLDALNNKGKIYTLGDLCAVLLSGGEVSNLVSWGIHKTFAQKLEDFWKQQLIDAEFLKRIGISEEADQLTVLQALEAAEIRTYGSLLSSFPEVSRA